MALVQATGLRISVIIATENDAGLIVQTIHAARSLGDVQIIVVDSAASVDGTRALAKREGVKTLRVPGERGRQMRAAVSSANGDVLLFIPPGCRLPPRTLEAIRGAVSDAQVLGGVFRARLAGSGGRHLLTRTLHSVLRLIGIHPYGAPWFVWRTAAECDGGFRALRVFEDRDLLHRLRRRGKVIVMEPRATLEVDHGLHRLIWTLMQVPHMLGVPAKLLGSLYRKPRSSSYEQRSTAEEAAEQVTPPVETATG